MNSSTLVTLGFGLKKRCPSCGKGRLFEKGWTLNEECSICGCQFIAREDDTYFFMYISTGFITGIFIVLMFFVVPSNIRFGKWVLLLLSVGLFGLTHPYRKGIAIAIDYIIDNRSEHPKHHGRK